MIWITTRTTKYPGPIHWGIGGGGGHSLRSPWPANCGQTKQRRSRGRSSIDMLPGVGWGKKGGEGGAQEGFHSFLDTESVFGDRFRMTISFVSTDASSSKDVECSFTSDDANEVGNITQFDSPRPSSTLLAMGTIPVTAIIHTRRFLGTYLPSPELGIRFGFGLGLASTEGWVEKAVDPKFPFLSLTTIAIQIPHQNTTSLNRTIPRPPCRKHSHQKHIEVSHHYYCHHQHHSPGSRPLSSRSSGGARWERSGTQATSTKPA